MDYKVEVSTTSARILGVSYVEVVRPSFALFVASSAMSSASYIFRSEISVSREVVKIPAISFAMSLASPCNKQAARTPSPMEFADYSSALTVSRLVSSRREITESL